VTLGDGAPGEQILISDEGEPPAPGGGALSAGGTEMAVAGFVLSVLWLFFLGSIAGLCLGLAARRRFGEQPSADELVSRPWAGKLAVAAAAIGGLGTGVAVVLAALQVLGVLDITAACHPAVTGVSCTLVIH